MNANKETLTIFFQEAKGIFERKAKFYLSWRKRILLYTEMKFPLKANSDHVKWFLTHLAFDREVPSSTQNHFFKVLFSLYGGVFRRGFGDY